MENCREFAPLIADAARQRADFVVLPETLTYYRMGKSYADCAEPVPGPSTDYFGTLAKQYDLNIVAGLLDRLPRTSTDKVDYQALNSLIPVRAYQESLRA